MMRTRLSICRAKRTYQSEADASGAAALADGLDLRPYRCDRCRAFHLTSRRKGKRVPRPPGVQAGQSATRGDRRGAESPRRR